MLEDYNIVSHLVQKIDLYNNNQYLLIEILMTVNDVISNRVEQEELELLLTPLKYQLNNSSNAVLLIVLLNLFDLAHLLSNHQLQNQCSINQSMLKDLR